MSGLDVGPLSDHLQRVGLGSHAKLERQGSKGSKCSTPSHKVHSPLGNTDKQSPDLHGLLNIVGITRNISEQIQVQSGVIFDMNEITFYLGWQNPGQARERKGGRGNKIANTIHPSKSEWPQVYMQLASSFTNNCKRSGCSQEITELNDSKSATKRRP